MEKMYQDYRDIAEFRLVYITEAHASDGTWPVPYAKELGITKHKNYGQRCQTAEKLLKDKSLTIPTLIDGMDNAVNKAYKAHPDRIFLVRKDGRLGVAGKRGPFGYKPALRRAKAWLASYKENGKEPEITAKLIAEDSKDEESKAKDVLASAPPVKGFEPVLGEWQMKTEFQGNEIAATMSLTAKEGKVIGVWSSRGREMPMSDLKFEAHTLRFARSMGGGMSLTFEGKVTGDKVSGKYITPFGELKCSGERSHPDTAGSR